MTWEPESLACPNSEWRFPHLWCDSHTSFKVKGSRSQGPLTLTHIFRTARLIRTSNLVHGWRTTTRISHRRHDLKEQRSRSRDYSEPSILAHCSTGVIRVWRGHTVSTEPGDHTFCNRYFALCCMTAPFCGELCGAIWRLNIVLYRLREGRQYRPAGDVYSVMVIIQHTTRWWVLSRSVWWSTQSVSRLPSMAPSCTGPEQARGALTRPTV